jgi:hypothetical protein
MQSCAAADVALCTIRRLRLSPERQPRAGNRRLRTLTTQLECDTSLSRRIAFGQPSLWPPERPERSSEHSRRRPRVLGATATLGDKQADYRLQGGVSSRVRTQFPDLSSIPLSVHPTRGIDDAYVRAITVSLARTSAALRTGERPNARCATA